MLSPEVLQQLYGKWQKLLNPNEGETLKKSSVSMGKRCVVMEIAMNQNIIRKWCLSILKIIELYRPKLSMKKKRFLIGLKPVQYLEKVLKV